MMAFMLQRGCCGGASRACFDNQPRDEALPTVDELKALEAEILEELETLNVASSDPKSAKTATTIVAADAEGERRARLQTMALSGQACHNP